MKKIPENAGFKVPDNYFENIKADQLAEKANMPSLPKDDGMRVPSGYFESFRVPLPPEVREETTRILRPRRQTWFLAAASVSILVLLGISMLRVKYASPTFDQLAQSEIENYLADKELDMSDLEFSELIPVEGFEINDVVQIHLQNENILEYLDNSMEDPEDLNLVTDEE